MDEPIRVFVYLGDGMLGKAFLGNIFLDSVGGWATVVAYLGCKVAGGGAVILTLELISRSPEVLLRGVSLLVCKLVDVG